MTSWKQAMIDKLGSEEAFSEYMRSLSHKSSKNKGKKGGFAGLKESDPELLKEIQRKGGLSRQNKSAE